MRFLTSRCGEWTHTRWRWHRSRVSRSLRCPPAAQGDAVVAGARGHCVEFGRVHGAIGGVPRSVCRDEHIEMPCRSVPISEGHRHTHWAYSYPQSLCLFTQRRRRRPVALPCRLGPAVLALPSWPCRLGPAVLALLCQSRRLGPAWRGWCATAVCAVAIASAFLGGAAAPAALSDRGQRQQRQAARGHRRFCFAFCCRRSRARSPLSGRPRVGFAHPSSALPGRCRCTGRF